MFLTKDGVYESEWNNLSLFLMMYRDKYGQYYKFLNPKIVIEFPKFFNILIPNDMFIFKITFPPSPEPNQRFWLGRKNYWK